MEIGAPLPGRFSHVINNSLGRIGVASWRELSPRPTFTHPAPGILETGTGRRKQTANGCTLLSIEPSEWLLLHTKVSHVNSDLITLLINPAYHDFSLFLCGLFRRGLTAFDRPQLRGVRSLLTRMEEMHACAAPVHQFSE
jgi:hypothetical protein